MLNGVCCMLWCEINMKVCDEYESVVVNDAMYTGLVRGGPSNMNGEYLISNPHPRYTR